MIVFECGIFFKQAAAICHCMATGEFIGCVPPQEKMMECRWLVTNTSIFSAYKKFTPDLVLDLVVVLCYSDARMWHLNLTALCWQRHSSR